MQVTTPVGFLGAQIAWLSSLRAVLTVGEQIDGVRDPLSVGSAFGTRRRPTRELRAVCFGVAEPRRRLISGPAYSLNLGYAVAQTIWVLTGAEDLESITFYNARGSDFTDDGRVVPSAPGRRIFGTVYGDQFSAALERLRADPTTRRAMIQIYLPEDLLRASRDCSCIGSLQLFLRGGRLECIVTMRSQSAALVMPYDLFLFTMLHEAASRILNVELGKYYHFCGSMHIYEDEIGLAAKILETTPSNEIDAMDPMGAAEADVWQRLGKVEADIRARLRRNPDARIPFNEYELDAYWESLLCAMVAGARRRLGAASRQEEERSLPGLLRRVLTR